MPLTRAQKQKIVEELKEKIGRQKAIVFVDISGIKVTDLTELRKKMKQSEGELKVAKKTLISLALKESGTEIDFKKIPGEIALGFAYQDETAPFKILYNFSKENPNLKILGGLISDEIFSSEQALRLAKLPAKETILSQWFFNLGGLVSAIVKGPNYQIINLLKYAKRS